MANEAVIIFETHVPIPFICSTTTAVEKGTVMKMADPFTASASTGNADIIAGIAAEEKLNPNDGHIAVYRGGIFKMIASGSITCGEPLVTAAPSNGVVTAATNAEVIIGIALETATLGETFLMELRPTVMQLA